MEPILDRTGMTGAKTTRLAAFLTGNHPGQAAAAPRPRRLIGVLKGCGIGPEVIDASLRVLAAAEETTGDRFELREGGAIGEHAHQQSGEWLTAGVIAFCAEVFAQDGAILNGPGGGRYVYDLRRRFDLFCKFVPVRPWPELAHAGKIAPQHLKHVDLLIVRDNTGGVYQGTWRNHSSPAGRVAEHHFSYNETQIQRLVEVAARAAAARRGKLHVIIKDGGVQGISDLWCDVSLATARKHGVAAAFMNIDLAAYELIQHPAAFDVMVAPNLFGDVLADISGVLLSSRGVTFSGNFDAAGHGVYQTNHGCAHDLGGKDVANPAGQILSLAMLLHESFGLDRAAGLIERSLAGVWRAGWRTEDLAEPGCRVIGTRAMTDRVVEQMFQLAGAKDSHEACVAAG
jgi:3-isopropylmalate dehydrogenase